MLVAFFIDFAKIRTADLIHNLSCVDDLDSSTTVISISNMQRYLIMVSWRKGLMAGSEPLIKEADPHITKLAIGARIWDKVGPKKSS